MFPGRKTKSIYKLTTEKMILFFYNFTSDYYLMIINKLLSKFGRNPGLFKKVIKISIT